MKKSLIVFIAAILIGISIFTVTTYNKSTSKANLVIKNTNKSNTPVNKSEEVKPNSIKTKAIDFKLKDLDGKEVSLSELKGKKVFLNFWATWCPPCRSEMPEIETLFQETKDSDLVILTLSIGETSAKVKSFIHTNKYSFKVLLDSNKSIQSKYGVTSIPTSYFIDVDGNIVSKHIGGMSLNQMKAYIKKLDK